MEDIRKKQEYLKKEIVDQKYDQDKFINFILSKKVNGDDLNNWNIDELTILIKEFKKEIDNGNNSIPIYKNENIFSETTMKNANEDINTDKDKTTKNNNKRIDLEKLSSLSAEDSNSFSDQYLCTEIICKIQDKSRLNSEKINVSIIDHKNIEGGIFTSGYTVYSIKTDPFDWIVKRRYSDFENLRNILCKMFPGHMIPSIPSKKMGKRRFDLDFILKRMVFLQKFVDSLLENEYIKSSELMNIFLSQSDRNSFESKIKVFYILKKEFSSYSAPLMIEEFKTFDGKLGIIFNDELDKYYNNLGEFNRFNSMLSERLNEGFRNLNINMKNVLDNIDEISKDLDLIFKLNKKVNSNKDIITSYEEMRNFMNSWSILFTNKVSIYEKQNELFKTYFKQFFKFNKMECDSYSQILKNRIECREKYNSDLLKLNIKKEKAWSHGDISKWELSEEDARSVNKVNIIKDKSSALKMMFHRETILVTNLQRKTGYYNKMCLDEMRRWNVNFSQKIKENLKKCSEDFYEVINETHKAWSDFAANIISI